MAGKPLVQQFVDDVEGILDKYRDEGLSYCEAIGAIETIKIDLWSEIPSHDDLGLEP